MIIRFETICLTVASAWVRYKPISEAVQANLASQHDTLQQLTVAHQQFIQLKPAETEIDSQRKAFFKLLSDSCAEFMLLTEAAAALIR